MRYRYLAALLVVAALCVPALADAGDGLTRKVTRALKIAKQADARSKTALAAVTAPSKGDIGPAGERGADGPHGASGRDGVDGAAGLAGAKGADGSTGQKGDPGRDGIGSVYTATNAEAVRLGASGAMTDAFTVAETMFSVARSGLALIHADGQIASVRPNAGTPPGPTPVTCSIEVDGMATDTREFDLAAGATQLVALHSAVPLSAGSHHAALVCHRSNGMNDAVAEFAAHRARLSVLGG